MSYKMSIQMVTEYLKATNKDDDNVVLCVQMFLRCIDEFNRHTKSQNEERELFEDVTKVCSKVTGWMKQKHIKSESDRKAYIEVTKPNTLIIILLIFILIAYFHCILFTCYF